MIVDGGDGPLTFEDLFRDEYPRLVPMLQALTGDRALAEDLAQEALVRAERHWDRLAGYDRPGAWVRRVALHLSANARRRRRREATALGRMAPAARSEVDVDVVLELSGDDDELWACVRSLPDQQRFAVALYYVADRSVADVAEVLGCSEGAVKTHLSRARATLGPPARPAGDGGAPVTMIDDERLDRRLRRAGERLRHEAPDRAATDVALAERIAVDAGRPAGGPRRWVVPAVLAAVAASALAVILVARPGREAADGRPAGVPDDVAVRVYAADFDGDGGRCLEVLAPGDEAVRGCVPGEQRTWGRPVLAPVGGGTMTIVATTETGRYSPYRNECFDDLPRAADGSARFVDVVTCGDGRPVYGLLPTEPWGRTTWFVRTADGRDVAVTPVDGTGATWVFDVPGAAQRPCLVIATQLGAGGWVDACSSLPTVRALTGIGDGPALIGPAADDFEVLSDARAAGLGCPDLRGLLRATLPFGGVTVRLSCRGTLAVAVQGGAELALGRVEPLTLALELVDGEWRVVADGDELSCEPADAPPRFCAAFGPVTTLADAAAEIPRL